MTPGVEDAKISQWVDEEEFGFCGGAQEALELQEN